MAIDRIQQALDNPDSQGKVLLDVRDVKLLVTENAALRELVPELTWREYVQQSQKGRKR